LCFEITISVYLAGNVLPSSAVTWDATCS
jgi:hypothetical protein